MPSSFDVVVVGGGVVGLNVAWELAGQGLSVAVLERGAIGREASWAGAGILPPGNLAGATTPEALLRALSHEIWPILSAQLKAATGIDNGFLPCGGIETALGDDRRRLALEEEIAAWQAEGVIVERLDEPGLRRMEPAVAFRGRLAFRLPELSQVRNPRHLKALTAACLAKDVALLAGEEVYDFEVVGERLRAVHSTTGRREAAHFVFCTGAWTRLVLARLGPPLPIEPVRGQIVQLQCERVPFCHVLLAGPRYLVPRPDGWILVGSTEERIGFQKQNTAEAVAELIRFAVDLVPELGAARFARAWSGLRPKSNRPVPFLGPLAGLTNAFVAAGHFRAGLQMSPGSARLIRQAVMGEPTTIPLEPFACPDQA